MITQKFVLTTIGSGSLALCLLFILVASINKDADIVCMREKRATLVYQLENQTYKNDNNIGTNELMNEVADFNGSILAGREYLKNPWTSWTSSQSALYVEPIDISNY